MAATTNVVSVNGGATQSRASSPAVQEMQEKLELVEEMTRNVGAVQERVLAEILGRNAESDYLAKFGLAGGAAAGRAAFRAKVPMVTYEDLKPYIMRIANGDRSPVLSGSGNPASEFFFSSGTSGGEPKLFPTVKDEFDRRRLLHSIIMAVINQFVPGNGEGIGLQFLFVRSETKTPSGLPSRTIQTSYYKSDHFKNDAYHSGTSPMAAILCPDVFQSMYAQMVCGLCRRHDVVRVGTAFASGLVRAIQFLKQHWEQLTADIEAGELSPTSVSDPSGVLQGCLGRYRHTRRPNAKLLDTIATGSMTQYVPALNYYSGGLPIASTKYVSTECFMGVNLHPMSDPSQVSYTIMPNMAYFEFLPMDAAVVELADVEAGREYEVVVTTYTGLSRYRVGDVLRVTGFHNSAPQFRFVGRRNVLLSIDADKTDEAELQRSVERASTLLRRHGGAVLDYTSQACTKSVPGHYVLYRELKDTQGALAQGLDGDVLDMCCVYRVLRVDGLIGPLEIRVVRSGTFEELADYAASHGGASIGQ
ncbi:hypothetical protein U9M48_005075 [Paspalum notatum var. saurae]|uniref:Uncharacterized protein n=1 Tax=Paspalum notatum var. saurae TaxID=547442 RepID=A0AAQ3PPD4_PASNO